MLFLRAKYGLTFILLFALAFVQTKGFAREMKIPSIDRVARADWPYKVLTKLAADNLVPGYAARVFEGDRLFDRIEMAGIVSQIIRSNAEKDLHYGQLVLINKLLWEFKPELRFVDPEAIRIWEQRPNNFDTKKAVLMGYGTGLATINPNTNPSSNISGSGFLNLSDKAFGMASFAVRREQFFHQNSSNSAPDNALVEGYDRNLRWTFGFRQMNWGPSYVGSLIQSDNIKTFLQGQGTGEIQLGFLGWFKVTQLVGTWNQDDKTVFLISRRWEKPLSKNLHLGFTEAGKTNVFPNPLIFAVPIYVYELIYKNQLDPQFNAVYNLDLTYRDNSGIQGYFEWVIDDITAPKWLFPDRFTVPQRAGYTIGFYTPHLFKGNLASTFRAEYTFIDQLTYTARRTAQPELAYTYGGDVIGSPVGPNSNAFYLRLDQYISPKLDIITEYLNQKQRSNGVPLRGDQSQVSVQVSYDIMTSTSVGVRVAPYTITFPGTPSEKGTLYEFRASWAF